MRFSCGLAPGADTPELAQLIESAGYERLWLYDSPVLHADVWMTLALAAERTSTIGLGPGLTVPSLRHVMVLASAIATLEQQAPGRTAVAIGTGFTARLLLGQPPMRWSEMESYVRQLRGLLRGDEVEVDGSLTKMLHPPGYAAARPLAVPLVIAANGPKGLRVARELGDGVMCVKQPVPGFEWSIVAGGGTVLDDGEPPDSDRALAAVGPYLTMLYHYFYDAPTDVDIDSLPLGGEWRRRIDEIPNRERHLRLHESRMVGVAPRDRDLGTGESILSFSWTGTARELQAKFAQFEAAGATEIYYEPTGPDLEREIVTFARAVGLSG